MLPNRPEGGTIGPGGTRAIFRPNVRGHMDKFALNQKVKSRRVVCAWLGALAIGFAPMAAWANDDPSTFGSAKEAGLGSAAAVSNLVYGPVKVAWATCGTVIAGFAWAFSGGDAEVASTVLTRAVRGTYVITPETLRGRREVEFVGRSPEYRSAAPAQVASAPDAPDGW